MSHIEMALEILDNKEYGHRVLNAYKKTMIGRYVYHGSTGLYDVLEPTGLDLGNKFENPGWSLYTWKEERDAFGWSTFQVIKQIKSHCGFDEDVNCLNSNTACLSSKLYNKIIDVLDDVDNKIKTYYIYRIIITDDMTIGLGHSSNTKNCVTIKNPHIIPYEIDKYILTKEDIDRYTEISDNEQNCLRLQGINHRRASIFMDNDLMYNFAVNKSTIKFIKNAISKGELVPGESLDDFIKNNNLTIAEVDMITRLKMSIMSTKQLRDDYNKHL